MQKLRFFSFSLVVAMCAYMTLADPTQAPSQEMDNADDKNYTLCTTQDCLDVASKILANLNQTVEPCDNFYQFACGGWVNNHPVNASEPHTSSMLVIGTKTREQIKEILEDVSKADTCSLAKARKLYAMCMDDVERQRVGSSTCREYVQKNGGWPMSMSLADWNEHQTWQDVSYNMLGNIRYNGLYHVQVVVDDKKSDSHTIAIMEPFLFIPREIMINIGQDPEQKAIYKSFIEEVARICINDTDTDVDDATFAQDASDLVDFEIKVANITMPYEDSRDIDKIYNEQTPEKLQEMYDSQRSSSKSKIDWLAVLQRIFTPLGITIESSEKIVVQAYNFLTRLAPLLEQTSDRTIVNYMQWSTMRYMLKYSDDRLKRISSQMDEQFLGQPSNVEKQKVCQSVNLNMAISHEYAKNFVNHENVEEINEIIMDVKDAVREDISQSTWMDEATREASLDKLADMRKQISTPEWYNDQVIDEYYDGFNMASDYFESVTNLLKFEDEKSLRKLRKPVDKNEWGVEPTVVQAFNNPSGNVIIITAAFLQDPMYDRNRFDFMNYGSIGFVIGHEISHGFDNLGRKYDKNGNFVQWWSQQSIDQYENITKCYVKQYNSYQVSGLDEVVYENGALSLGENIGDSAAVIAAYKAYKNKKSRMNQSDVRLPGLEKYSDEQLLFISTAHTLCENATPQNLAILLLEEHATAEWRIRGSLSNSYDFSSVYNCPVGKGMNPEEKCPLWH